MNLTHRGQNSATPPVKFAIGTLALSCGWGTIERSIKASLGLATALLLCLENSIVFALPPQRQVAQSSSTAQAGPETNQLFVNPTAGNDTTGNGSDRAPFKTITQALRVAKANTVIFLAPGTYSQQGGEIFPLQLKPGITLQGDPTSKGRNIIIRGGGTFISPTFASQNIAILAANKSGVAGVTVTNSNRRGYGLWIESSSPVVADNTFIGNSHDGVSVAGNSSPLIRNNYFADNGGNGITIYGSSRPEVRENVFERTGFAINIGHNAAPLLNGNRISQNTDGIVVQGRARPILRRNIVESNSRDGLVALAETLPDLGTPGEPGGNIFRNNGRYELNVSASNQIISAYGNQLASRRIAGRLNLDGNVTQVNAIPVSSPASLDPVAVQSSGGENAVRIAVPPPARATRRRVRRSRTRYRRVRRPTQQIAQPPSSIPTSTTIPVPSSAQTQPGGMLPNAGVQPGVLPVPNAQIPLGNTANSPTASTTGLALRYRVVVEVRTLEEQKKLLSLVPRASRTLSQGRVVMLAGTYNDRAGADEMLQKINSNGLIGSIEETY